MSGKGIFFMFVAVCMCFYAIGHAEVRNVWWLMAVASVWLCGVLA